MIILQLITNGLCGGPPTSTLGLVRQSIKDGDQVLVGMGEPKDWMGEELEKIGVETTIYRFLKRSWNPLWSILFILEFRRFLKKNSVDVVHFHGSNPMFGVYSLIGMKKKPKTVATLHGLSILHPGWKKSRLMQKAYTILMRSMLHRMDRVIYVSHADLKLGLSLKLVPESQSEVIHNGLPSEMHYMDRDEARKFLSGLDLSSEKIIIGTVARFHYQKHLELMLLAADYFRDRPYLFCLVGSGPEKEHLQNMIDDLGLQDSAKIVETKQDAAKLISGFDLFLMTSRFEGLPHTILEAARARVPVIATDVGGVCEIVEDGVSGRLIKSGELKKVIDAIEEFTQDTKLGARFSEELYKKVSTHFSRQQMIDKTLRVLKNV